MTTLNRGAKCHNGIIGLLNNSVTCTEHCAIPCGIIQFYVHWNQWVWTGLIIHEIALLGIHIDAMMYDCYGFCKHNGPALSSYVKVPDLTNRIFTLLISAYKPGNLALQ